MNARKTHSFILAVGMALVLPNLGFPQSGQELSQIQGPEEAEIRVDPLAAILTVINIPARAGLCAANGVLGSIVMGASAGRRYGDAAQIMEAGCSGPWVITPEMLDESRSRQKSGRRNDTP